MLVDINYLLNTILFVLLIVLVIILIIFGIKLIKTLKKVDNIIEDVNVKLSKTNGIFEIVDRTADYAATISDKVIGFISSCINKLFKKKKGEDLDEQE